MLWLTTIEDPPILLLPDFLFWDISSFGRVDFVTIIAFSAKWEASDLNGHSNYRFKFRKIIEN